MYLVPIGGGGDGHTGNGKVFVDVVKGRGAARPAAGNHRRAHLHALIEGRGVKQPVGAGQQGAVGVGVVYRAAQHEAVRRLEFGGDLVHRVQKHAVAHSAASAAGNAAADILIAHGIHLGLYALGGKHRLHFGKGAGHAPLGIGAAVDH